MLDAGMRKRWRMRAAAPSAGDHDRAAALQKALALDPLIAQLLVQRGIDNPETAERFLQPSLNHLHDPALLPGAERAAQRIAQAVRDKQPIVVYGDYDVDGVTASAILWHTLKLAGADVTTYVPHRVDEGYGLNSEAIAQLCQREDGRKPLIVSVDCGITAIEPAKAAKACGGELIITDHHTFDPEQLPEASVLVHPQLPLQPGEAPYPCEHLCGAGVAFKVAWQIGRALCGSDRLPQAMRELLIDLLSFAALGTVADVVPLVDENRVLTTFGLSRIKETRFVGLNALIDASRLRDEKIDAYHVGFVLGPRLNACGRMGHAGEAVRLLTEADAAEAVTLAKFLAKENDRRRVTERGIFQEAERMVLDGAYHAEHCRAIVLGKEGWHPGVVGIVASRLVDRFSRPAVVLNIDEAGVAHGSARSVDGISIHEAFTACSEHLDRYGGHAMAAGLALPSHRLDAFRAALVQFVNERLTVQELRGLIEVDAALPLESCTLQLFDQLGRLAPFGRGNPRPRLLIERAQLDEPAKLIGKQGNHLSLRLRQQRRMMRAVAFGMGEFAEQLPGGATLDVVFEPQVSMFQGLRRPEIHVQDIGMCDG